MTFKQIAVRLPRLLDKDLNEVRRLRPRAQTIELNIAPLSTASLTLDDGSGVGIRAYVELYNAKGSVGIYRTTLPDASYSSGERVSLEHGICTLDDAVITGKGKLEGTPISVLSGILANQTTHARGEPMWTLGAVEAPNDMTISIEYDGTKTLEALSDAMRELQGYMLTFDQSGFPWVMNVVKKPENVACEGRLSRNIRTIRKTEDDGDLCTRLYCSLLDGGYIESDTVSVWGVVEQNITLNDDMPKDSARAYCQRYLENRKNPVVAIEIDALEWFAMTGERIDRFEIGDICRLALPDYGTVIEERIVALSYTNALGMPETVTVSLANQIEDLSIKTADTKRDVDNLKNKSTGYGNQFRTTNTEIQNLKDSDEGIKKINNKFVKWFSDVQIDLDATEEGADVGILAKYETVHGLEEEFDKRISLAEITLHGDEESATVGLVAKMTEVIDAEKDIKRDLSEARLTLYGDEDHAEAGLVSRFNTSEGKTNEAYLTLYGDDEQSKAGLVARFDDTEGKTNEAYLVLNGTPDNPSAGLVARVGNNESGLKVYKDSASIQNIVDGKIVTEINASKEGVTINAAKINLNGYVTASEFSTEIATLKREYADYIETAALSTQSLGANYIDTNTFSIGGTQLKLLSFSRMTGGSISSGSSPSYKVWSGGSVIGTVNVPGDYSFKATFASEKVHYLGYE